MIKYLSQLDTLEQWVSQVFQLRFHENELDTLQGNGKKNVAKRSIQDQTALQTPSPQEVRKIYSFTVFSSSIHASEHSLFRDKVTLARDLCPKLLIHL